MVYTDYTSLVLRGLLCGPAHVDARGWSVGSFCDGEVHPDPTAV